VRIGWNSRLDTIQAAILLVKFDAFQEYELEDVNRVATWYTEVLKDKVKTPVVPDGYSSSWAQYTIQVKNEKERTALQRKLKEQGIPTMVYYPSRYMNRLHIRPEAVCRVSGNGKLCQIVLALPLDSYKSKKIFC
jgi:dTDP-4-amino-4,6-dideoxygalactose transaminase